MTNNDILRRLRYILDLNDQQLIAIFAQADYSVTREQICNWLKKEEEPDYKNCSDQQLAHFLNGLITEKRGKKDGPMPKAEKSLNNNLILTKLKIAFNLKADDMLTLLASTGLNLSQHELSAFFRKPAHRHYRSCKDQVLRKLLTGLQHAHRPSTTEKTSSVWAQNKTPSTS